MRNLLLEAATQVIGDIDGVPDKANVHFFMQGYVEGKKVAEIAEELGVSREWCSRAYRKEAFELAGAQFMMIISQDQ